MDTLAVNGWYISLLQLSVASNLTFTVILSLFDTPLKKERDAIDSLQRGINLKFDRYEEQQLSTSALNGLKNEADRLRNSVEGAISVLSGITYKWVRPICFCLALVALGYLVQVSLSPDLPASPSIAWISLGSLTPLVVFGVIAILFSLWIEIRIGGRRKRLDDMI